MMNDRTVQKIETMLLNIKKQITPVRIKITDIKTMDCGYKTDNTVPEVTEEWRSFGEYDRWGMNPEEHRWFYTKLRIPDELVGSDAELYIASTPEDDSDWDPQYMAYVDGKFVRGMDSNHRYLKIDSTKKEQDIHVYAYSAPFGEKSEFYCEFCVFEREAEKLYYNIAVPFDALPVLDKLSSEYVTTVNHLYAAINMLDWRTPGSEGFLRSVKKANEYLETEFYGKCCKDNGKVVS